MQTCAVSARWGSLSNGLSKSQLCRPAHEEIGKKYFSCRAFSLYINYEQYINYERALKLRQNTSRHKKAGIICLLFHLTKITSFLFWTCKLFSRVYFITMIYFRVEFFYSNHHLLLAIKWEVTLYNNILNNNLVFHSNLRHRINGFKAQKNVTEIILRNSGMLVYHKSVWTHINYCNHTQLKCKSQDDQQI